MTNGITSRRCACGQTHFFVKDEHTANWLADQNEGSQRNAVNGYDTFIHGCKSAHCSRCGVPVIGPYNEEQTSVMHSKPLDTSPVKV